MQSRQQNMPIINAEILKIDEREKQKKERQQQRKNRTRRTEAIAKE